MTPWTAEHQASLFITNSRSLPRLMSIELVMPSNHLILCRPLLLPSIFPRIRVFSNESTIHIRWPKYWSFSFNISPSNEHSGLIALGYIPHLFLFITPCWTFRLLPCLAIVNSAYIFSNFGFYLGIYPGVGLLYYVVGLFLVF